MFEDFFDEDDPDAKLSSEGEDAAEAASATLPPPRDNPDLLGHGNIESAILDAYNDNKLPHAMVFAGPMGIGKATAAFRIARFLFKNGLAGGEQNSLFGDTPAKPESLYVSPEDPAFKLVASGGHPDLRTFERPLDEKKGVKKGVVDIDTIRKIAPFLRMSASEGGWRVAIVDEAETMNIFAQNALLKILEEPPPNALLVLVCERPGAMLPTIRSRCRVYNFQPLGQEDLAALVKRAVPTASSSDLALLTHLADGSPGRAIQLFEDGGLDSLRTIFALLEDRQKPDWVKIHLLADTLSRAEAEKAYAMFAFAMEWTAQALLKASAAPGTMPLPPFFPESLKSFPSERSLSGWSDTCERLTDHFRCVDGANLDRKHGVIGAFAILAGNA